MDDTVVITNDLTAYGLRRIHLMRNGDVPDVGPWIQLVPREGEESLELHITKDDLGMQHLWLLWQVHDAVKMGVPGKDGTIEMMDAVLWLIEKGQRLRDVVDDAAGRYLAYFDEWPNTVMVENLKVDGEGRKVEKGLTVQVSDGPELIVEKAAWVPKRCLAMIKKAEGGVRKAEKGEKENG